MAAGWAKVSCSATHCVALRDGAAFTWPITREGNRFGQLGIGEASKTVAVAEGATRTRDGTPGAHRVAASLSPLIDVAAGGGRDGGHTALVDGSGRVWVFGCDRWQQLGLAAASTAGSAQGYTWRDGRIWQPSPQLVPALAHRKVGAVALGADHCVALDANERDVYTWGRGEAGQLGGSGRPFVRAPGRADNLSAPPGGRVVRIDAEGDCTAVQIERPDTDTSSSGHSIDTVFAGRCRALRERFKHAAADVIT